ncbi:hypothetical protein HY642_06605 [Candidatus Woesearchaeota archaeon]|nr:hypothetical protein [Candidatus Woesearchaeota archaeon]
MQSPPTFPTLLVSYPQSAGYLNARSQVLDVLRMHGDDEAEAELAGSGALKVKTSLDVRELIEDLRHKYAMDPQLYRATKRWLPVDMWCRADVQSIVDAVKSWQGWLPENTWAPEVEIIDGILTSEQVEEALTKGTAHPLSWARPSYIVQIVLFRNEAAISIRKEKDVFLVL